MRFLIVDDDFISRKLMNHILSRYAYCDIAASGEEAVLAYKLAKKEKIPYQLIFMDILMPGSGGMEALRLIRDLEDRRNMPLSKRVKVIMATSIEDPAKVKESFMNQCDDYIVKPIDEMKVLNAVNKAGCKLSEREL